MQVWREDGVALAALAAQAAAADTGAETPGRAAGQGGRGSRPDAAPQPKGRSAEGGTERPAARQIAVVAEEDDGEPVPRGIIAEGTHPAETTQARAGLRLMERLLGDRGEGAPAGNLSKDDIRRLQATLFELLECKRILDQAR